jgi:ABC-type multidrug transport system fused ATPase/permease subunit
MLQVLKGREDTAEKACPSPLQQRPLPVPAARTIPSLRGLFAAYRWQILFTYGLFTLENLLVLAQPLVLGLAINGLLQSSYLGLGLFVVQHFSHVLIGTLRRMYDARAFIRIYNDLASRLVLEQRRREVDVSRVAARSALSREIVDFFERYLPVLLQGLYAVSGALVMLTFYDWRLVPWCLGLVLPLWLFNTSYARKTLRLSRSLHDELEQEVEVITDGRTAAVEGHYHRVGSWRIRLMDAEAINFSVMEVFVLGLLAVALVRSCLLPGASAGDIFAVFRYVLMFITGLDGVPMLVQQLSRLHDISRRIRDEASTGPCQGAASS